VLLKPKTISPNNIKMETIKKKKPEREIRKEKNIEIKLRSILIF